MLRAYSNRSMIMAYILSAILQARERRHGTPNGYGRQGVKRVSHTSSINTYVGNNADTRAYSIISDAIIYVPI